jgi:hypothetical protein
MADVLSELLARKGYARVQASVGYDEAWRTAVGEKLAAQSRVGSLKRGMLEAVVANNVVLQEMTFQKRDILRRLTAALPDERISDLRLRVGTIE